MKITLNDVETAIRKAKSGKTPGEDGIYYEMIRNGGYWMKVSLCHLFNEILRAHKIPEDWRNGLIVPLFKDGDPELAANYRGITLLSNVGKIFGSIIEKKLSKWCEENKIFEQEQAGFRPGKTTTHHIYLLAETILKRKKQRKPTYCCFLDIKKAYDTVWRDGLWEKLRNTGMNEDLVLVIQAMHEEVKSRVVMNGKLSSWFNLDIGLRQGCVLSPLLFLIFINDLLKELKESKLGVIIGGVNLSNLTFADDIALVANNRHELQKLVKIAENYARKWKFVFNTKKSKVVVFNRKKANPSIKLDKDKLEVVPEYKYLGVWFDARLKWKSHKAYVLAKAQKRAYAMFGFGIGKVLPTKACVNLWEVLVRPILEYASEVWGGGPWEQAEKLQREIARIILKVPVRTANEAVLGDLGWWELKARRDKARLKLYKKLMDYEDGHVKNLINDKEGEWINETSEILHRLDLTHDEVKFLDEKQWRAIVTSRTHKEEEKRWRHNMEQKSKLRTYRLVKKRLAYEPYLDFTNKRTRNLLTRLRSGTNFLRIEKGRYDKEAVEDRLCYLCKKVEDEKHFLLECDLYREVRADAFGNFGAHPPLDGLEQLNWVMGSVKGDKDMEKVLTHLILNCVKIRETFTHLL